jgi:putative ABC transport system permease protein
VRIRLKHQRLAELIAASGLTQNHWAIRLGLSRGHWSGLVNGNHPFPSAKTRTRILEGFGVEFDRLFEIDAAGDAWVDMDFRRAIADRYIVDAEVGQGGMGAVYLARDVRHGRLVAIKVIAPEAVSGIGLSQFQREISTVAQLHHPNILPLFESGDVAGQPYFVMPYVRGGSLRARLAANTRLAFSETLEFVRGITDALDHAHHERVLHCDIKPENILLHRRHAWLTDFGIARRLHTEVQEWPRRPGVDSSAGTPAYVSPEQATGDQDLDARSDVYSLGCVVYEMLSGRSPFGGANTQQIVARRFIEPPPPLRDFAPDVPADVQSVIERAMALPRERRYSSAGAFAEDLARASRPASAVSRVAHALWRGAGRAQQALRLTPHRPIGGQVRTLLEDIHGALRATRRNARFTALAAATIALGIGSVTAGFAVLDTIVMRPLPYEDSEQLVLMRERTAKGDERAPSYPNFDDWRRRATTFSGVAAVSGLPPQTVALGNEPLRVTALGVTRDYFRILGAPPLVGREFTGEETQPGGPGAVMVSEAFWRSQLGAAAIPATLRIGDASYPIVGVVPNYVRLFGAPSLYFAADRYPGTMRTAHAYMVVARVATGRTLDAARAEMTALSRVMLDEYGAATEAADANLTPLREYVVGSYRATLPYVVGAAGLVLLIACTNVVSVSLAHGLSRRREFAVRTALGAPRWRIARQLFAETGVRVAAGLAFGIVIAFGIARLVRTLGAGILPRVTELAIDARVLGFALALTVITALLIGMYPALRLSRETAGALLRGSRGDRTAVRMPMWRTLVGMQAGLALVLLVGSALMIQTLRNILSTDSGFDPRGVMTVELTPTDSMTRVDQFRAGLEALPGIAGVAFANHLPLDAGSYSAPLLRPSDPTDRDWPVLAGIRVVTAGYFEVLRQRIVSGRVLAATDRQGAPPVAVITRGAAERLWPSENPIGKVVATTYDTKRWMTVVGVVEEAASWTMARGSQHEIYIPLDQWRMHARYQLVAVIRTTGDPEGMIAPVRTRLRELTPGMPIRTGTLEGAIARSAIEPRFATVALVVFAGIALLLAGAGVYGVISYAVSTRQHEIGIRLALGASPQRVRGRLILDAVAMVGGGIVCGGLAAVFATRFLEASLYGVTRLDPLAYGASALVLLVAAGAGAYAPARRSSRTDPRIAMRAE